MLHIGARTPRGLLPEGMRYCQSVCRGRLSLGWEDIYGLFEHPRSPLHHMTIPIRWKITLSALIAITVGLLAAGWLALRSIERLELTRLEETLTSRTALAAVSLQRLVETDSP